MKLINVTEVTYEALGKEHVTYTELTELEAITSIIKIIIDTAWISRFKRVQITTDVFRDNNLSHIEKWYTAIGECPNALNDQLQT